MKACTLALRAALAAALSAGFFVPLVQAQVPDGSIVISSLRYPGSSFSGSGGLFLIYPSNPAVKPIAGLGTDLTGSAFTELGGANSVCVHPGDRALIVGEHAPQGESIELHRILLNGSSVVLDQTFTVGVESSAFGGGITQTALLPDGRILVGVFGIGSGPLANAMLGTVDLSTGLVAPIAVSLPGGALPALNALCIAPDGTTAWFANHAGGTVMRLFSVSVPVGGTAALHASFTQALVNNLAFDCELGRLVATAHLGSWAPYLIEHDPPSGQSAPACNTGYDLVAGVVIDRATGERIVAGGMLTGSSEVARIDPVTCANVTIAPSPVGGWGLPSGIDFVQAPVLPTSYCTTSTTTNGCTPLMSASANFASIGAGPGSFVLTGQGVEGHKLGLLLYGVSGRASIPWGPGSSSVLCVKPPLRRTTVQSTGGTSGQCNGVISLDFFGYLAQHPSALGQPIAVGHSFDVQAWFRDPPAPQGTNFSNAIEFSLCP